MGIIICTILILGAIVFFSNAVPALIEVKKNDTNNKYYFDKYTLIIGGICYFITVGMFMIFGLIYSVQEEKLKNYPKYEQIQEPIYRKIQ